ncbi:hypothetical protein JTB14_024444 [Gonioctena quinquepunctata]|nr:hypothetical protein JTB14_024444 [Gonioctena quinquepunctata]
MIGWIFRFAINSRKTAVEILGELTFEEIDRAEIRLLKSIQLETFGSNPNHLENLQITEDKNVLWRIITKLTEGEDSYNFKYPILIPATAPDMKISFKVQGEEIQENQQQESNTSQEDNITETAKGNKEGNGSIDDGVITVTRAGRQVKKPQRFNFNWLHFVNSTTFTNYNGG